MSANNSLRLEMTQPEGESDEFLTVGQLLDEIAQQLLAAGIEDPEISARRIVEEATGFGFDQHLLADKEPVTRRVISRVDAMSHRRASGEPLQYVIGSWGFRQLDLAVDSRALIPRPETESVAGFGIDALHRMSSGGESDLLVADLGTGSGAIALSIAQEVPQAQVCATDISEEALSLARSNLAGLGSDAARVSLRHGDWFAALSGELFGKLDLLISNPPYISPDDDLPKVVKDWEPQAALIGGEDGFLHLDILTRQGRNWIRPGGWLVLECGSNQAERLRELAISRGYEAAQIGHDLSGAQRLVAARRPIDDVAESDLEAATEALRRGDLVVAPTDTLPGLLAKYDDTAAVEASYEAKQRPRNQPVPVLVSGVAQAEELVQLDQRARDLIEEHWPGALTIVAKRLHGTDPVHGGDTLGVRCPNPGWLRLLIDQSGPVTGSSANLHGVDTMLNARDAALTLAVEAGHVIEGISQGGLASTVLDTTGESLIVLREGAVEIKHD